MTTPATILAIDDEVQILRLLQLTLEPAGFRLRTATTGRDGIAMTGTERPDLILLDLGLPDMQGQVALETIRTRSHVPVIILSVLSAESDIIGCLDRGADDYLVKPFRTGELLARIRTAIRRSTAPGGRETMTIRDLFVNFTSRQVVKGGVPVHLTATEYSLLTVLLKNSGRVLTHRYLLEQVWGPDFLEETQYTRVYVGQLRKKIEDDPASPRFILTESGIGYRMIDE
jgi:two-component system KDP operon response regulator KdpE